MNGSLAVFQCDADQQIGGGHVSRCLSIAGTLRDAGWACSFWTSSESAVSAAKKAGHHVVPRAHDDLPPTCELLVSDDYRTDRVLESRWRRTARRIAVLDDLADRVHDCDYLIDSGPGRSAEAYAGLLPGHARMALGPRFAPVRREFIARRSQSMRDRSGGPTRDPMVSICLGASDPHRLAARVATIAAGALPGWRIEAIVPDDQRTLLPAALERRIPCFVATGHRQDMAAMLAASDLAIGAGGVGTWERCVLGVPSAVIVTAENQWNNVRGASIAGACIPLGDWRSADEGRWSAAIEALAQDRDALIRMSTAAAGLCDGLGVERIAAMLGGRHPAASGAGQTPRAVAREAEGHSEGVWLRSAELADCRAIFEFQREPNARAHFRNPEPPTWKAHERWFAETMGREDRWIGMVCLDSTPTGMVRLDWHEADHWFEISILVSEASRGRGVGRGVLGLVRGRLAGSTLLAEVSEANAPSQRAFAAAGFARIAPDIFISRAR